jgi:hypothetical protein
MIFDTEDSERSYDNGGFGESIYQNELIISRADKEQQKG